MGKMIGIYCKNSETLKDYPLGTTLLEIMSDQKIELGHPILGAMVNNEIRELNYEIYKPKTIFFIDITHPDGMRMYIRSLSFVLYKASLDICPDSKLRIEHSVSNGIFCTLGLKSGEALDPDLVSDIKFRMADIINSDLPFKRYDVETEKAIELFEQHKMTDKVSLLEARGRFYNSIYCIDDVIDYFYGFLIPSTGYLKKFDLIPYGDGMLLRVPSQENPDKIMPCISQEKMFQIFTERREWGKILNISDIGDLNRMVEEKKIGDLIKISEALHEKKVAQIADRIHREHEDIKLILISGPSSSGKTTFCKRLAIQLQVCGLKPVNLSLDNYFVDRELTPRDENGDYDFEALEALDLKLFNQNLLDLLAGKEVEIPHFSFHTGKRYYEGTKLKLEQDSVLLVEGIHGLNPRLTEQISNQVKFKVYVSALTSISIDSHNRVPTTDNRLVRRIIRDHHYRNYTALDTIRRWRSVRRGEEKNIFPYQEEADMMFNSALLFELGVLKSYVEPLLREIPPNQKEYAEAVRLLKFFSYFKPIPEDEIPPTSIIREFLSGSSFRY